MLVAFRASVVGLVVAAALGVAPGSALALGQCRVDQLSARTTGPQAGLGHVGFVLVLTNRSSVSCVTGGFVGLQRLGANRQALVTRVHRGSGYLFPSAAPERLVVAPGHSVSAGVEWLDGPVRSEPESCTTAGHFLEVTPPNDTSHLTIRAATADCAQGYLGTTALAVGAHGPAV